MPIRVIISSCPADDKVHGRLIATLKASGPNLSQACWSHRSVTPGQQRIHSFAQALNTAQLAVLLISPDYLIDDHIQRELPQLLASADQGRITLVPVPVRAVVWERQPFHKYKPIWPYDSPLAGMKSADKDTCYVQLGSCIVDALDKSKPRAESPAPGPSPEASESPTFPSEPAAADPHPKSAAQASPAAPRASAKPSPEAPPSASAPSNAADQAAAPKYRFLVGVFIGVGTLASVLGVVVDGLQLLNLPWALAITAGIAVILGLRYIGPWRAWLRKWPTLVPILLGILASVWIIVGYKLVFPPPPKTGVTVNLTVLDREGRLVYDANVVSSLGTLKKESDRFVLALEKPVPPFQVYASRGMAEKGETQIAFEQPGTYTATIRLTAVPEIYTLYLSVFDETGTPISQAEITTPGQLKRTGNTWEITIAAVQKPSGPFQVSASTDEGQAGKTTVSLTDKEVQAIEIHMQRDTNAVLEGKVLNGSSQPIQGAAVMIEGYEAEAQTTDEHGRFSLRAHKHRNGWVRIIVNREGHDSFNQNVKVTGEVVTLVPN